MQYTDLPPRTLEFVSHSDAIGLHVLALQTAEEQGNVFDAKQRVTSFRVPHSKVFLAKSFALYHVSVLSNLSIDFSELMLRTFPKVIQSTLNVTLLSIISDYMESASKRNLM